MLFFAWLPVVYLGAGFFAYEQSLNSPEAGLLSNEFLEELPNARSVLGEVAGNVPGSRHLVWSWLLLTLVRYSQAFLMFLLIGMIGPPLISRDVRSRAFLLYFSRPLDVWEYVLGKAAVVWLYIAAITTLPALLLYILAVLLSPSFGVVLDTWDLPLRILAASALMMVPTTALILMFSSLTTESRYAGFAWFAVWVLGWVTYGVLTISDFENQDFDDRALDELTGLYQSNRWSIVSLYHMLGEMQGWVFGLGGSFSDVIGPLIVLTTITVIGVAVVLRRVRGQVRV
jgi:hypothetical protein